MVLGIIAATVGSVIGAVSSIGAAVSSFCANVLPTLSTVLGGLGEAIKNIGTVVLKVLGILNPDENVEDLGDRALQAADKGIRPENYSSYDQYLTEIRNFKLDPEKSASLRSEEKIGAGLAVGTVGLEKKFNVPNGSMGPIWVLAASNPEYFNADRLVKIVQSGQSMTDVMRYFEGKQSPADAIRIRDSLMGLERQRSPDKSDSTLYAEMMAARESVKNPARNP